MRAMRKITAAVVGVGYLGRFHAQKYVQAPQCELVGVVDARRDAREAVAAELGTRSIADYRELLGAVEAVSIVTPTPAHFAIARDFLESGAHVLVEKPITETPREARELIELAARRGRILQVGHLERFNSAILAAEPYLRAPRFVECHRLATLYFASPLVDGGHRLGVRQDVRRLLQSLILIHWDEDGRRTAVAGNDDVFAQVGNLVDDLAELSTKFTDGDDLTHADSAPY